MAGIADVHEPPYKVNSAKRTQVSGQWKLIVESNRVSSTAKPDGIMRSRPQGDPTGSTTNFPLNIKRKRNNAIIVKYQSGIEQFLLVFYVNNK